MTVSEQLTELETDVLEKVGLRASHHASAAVLTLEVGGIGRGEQIIAIGFEYGYIGLGR